MPVKLIRIFALTLVCSIFLTTFSSCGKNSRKHFVMKTYSTFGAEEDLAVYSEIMAEYTKTHKNVVINDTTTDKSNSYKMELSLTSTYKGSSSPDVIYYSAISDMSELGDYFVTIDEIRKDHPDFASGVSEAVLDSVSASDGKRYCIPIRGDWQGIIVNAALFRRSGLNIPETWDDIIKAAYHFKDTDVRLFANSLDDGGALAEYLVRGIGGTDSLNSAIKGKPDSAWKKTLDTLSELDRLSAFPPMKTGPFDYLVSALDIKNTAQDKDEIADAVELYNCGKAAILLIDNSMCGRINTDLDSQYIMLPSINTASDSFDPSASTTHSTTTTSYAGTTTTTVRRTLPITSPTNRSSGSGSGTSQKNTSAATTTSGIAVSATDTTTAAADTEKSETGLYVNFAEGFYITKKAYYDKDKQEDLLEFIEHFIKEENCVKLCSNYRVPSLAAISKKSSDSLTQKSNIYNAVINSVQSAKDFIVTTQTYENSFFWNHCTMALTYMSKGILSRNQAIALISDTQLTVADVYTAKTS
ncbi:MAG: ABC transporter substrate-binding protein [Acutalibacteraceae bacterium]